MPLWIAWFDAVRALRPAAKRFHTFLWMILALVGLCCRPERAGVTSMVRLFGFGNKGYRRFLHLFHSRALDLDALTGCWARLCLRLFQPVSVGGRLVCLADGIKAPKEGRKMPAVKLLHQQSASNSKPDYIMGHSLQAVSLLVQGPAGHVAAVPLVSRIHEGLVWSNRDTRTLLDKLALLLFSLAGILDRKLLLVADAYYASGKMIAQLLGQGHQLVTRAKSNAVAYWPAPAPRRRRRGRPRLYGEKVKLKDLARDQNQFLSAPSPVYGEQNVTLRYRSIDLLWRPAGRLVRFVIVRHPLRGTVFLMATDLTLQPLEIILLYGYRFKIELGFRQAVHVVGSYAYHFWMASHEAAPPRTGRPVSAPRKPDLPRRHPPQDERLPSACAVGLHRAGTDATSGLELHGRGLAPFPQLVAHHESRAAALGVGRGLRDAFHTTGISPSCGAPAQTENYSPTLQGAQQRLIIQQLRLGDRRMRQRKLGALQ